MNRPTREALVRDLIEAATELLQNLDDSGASKPDLADDGGAPEEYKDVAAVRSALHALGVTSV